MKKFIKKYFLFIGVPLVIVSSVLSVVYINNKNNNFNSEFIYDLSDKNYKKVYLLDESNTLVPLSIEVSQKEYLVDEIYSVVSKLRDLEIDGFTSVLAKDIKINKIEMENGVLNIDFSSEFLNYNKDIEEKIIESLTWSVMEFDEVKGLTLSVDGKKLTQMPLNGFKLPKVLDKSIGINKYKDMMFNCLNCESVVTIYSKNINDKEYYIPVTRNIKKSENMSIINALEKEVSLLSGLREVKEFSELKQLDLNGNEMNAHVSNDSLLEENLIDSKIYELLKVMLYYNDLDYTVNFFVDGESVMVNGYNLNEKIPVGSINFNQIKV